MLGSATDPERIRIADHMPLTVNPNEDAVTTALRAFLLDVLPTGFEVIQAQTNRVPEPKVPDFAVFTPVHRTRLATNVEGFGDDDVEPTTATVKQPTQFDFQVDIHGDQSSDACQIITTLTRSSYGCDFFDKNYSGISPLYANDPKQMPFNNAEQQYENRWVVEISLQADPAIIFPQQYADTLAIGVVSVEAKIPAQ